MLVEVRECFLTQPLAVSVQNLAPARFGGRSELLGFLSLGARGGAERACANSLLASATACQPTSSLATAYVYTCSSSGLEP